MSIDHAPPKGELCMLALFFLFLLYQPRKKKMFLIDLFITILLFSSLYFAILCFVCFVIHVRSVQRRCHDDVPRPVCPWTKSPNQAVYPIITSITPIAPSPPPSWTKVVWNDIGLLWTNYAPPPQLRDGWYGGVSCKGRHIRDFRSGTNWFCTTKTVLILSKDNVLNKLCIHSRAGV